MAVKLIISDTIRLTWVVQILESFEKNRFTSIGLVSEDFYIRFTTASFLLPQKLCHNWSWIDKGCSQPIQWNAHSTVDYFSGKTGLLVGLVGFQSGMAQNSTPWSTTVRCDTQESFNKTSHDCMSLTVLLSGYSTVFLYYQLCHWGQTSFHQRRERLRHHWVLWRSLLQIRPLAAVGKPLSSVEDSLHSQLPWYHQQRLVVWHLVFVTGNFWHLL